MHSARPRPWSKRVLRTLSLLCVPHVALCRSMLDWIDRPLDSLWHALEHHPEDSSDPVAPWHGRDASRPREPPPWHDRDAGETEPPVSLTDTTKGLPGRPHAHDDSDMVAPFEPSHDHGKGPPWEDRSSYQLEAAGDEYDSDQEEEVDTSDAPVLVYRFYGGKPSLSARTTRYSPTAIPFLCMGPNVDHWKPVAHELTLRGYNVMACERVPDAPLGHPHAPARVVRNLLHALRWNQVVLVACDADSLLAIQAARRLAPRRVVGLVLCGNLEETCRYLTLQQEEEQEQVLQQQNRKHGPHSSQRYRVEHALVAFTAHTRSHRKISPFALDRYLQQHLNCPFRIVWDGVGAVPPWTNVGKQEVAVPHGTRPVHTSGEPAENCRCQIIGGGSAPHRRRPEQFAWILTRFVEELVAPLSNGMVAGALPAPRPRGGQQPQRRNEGRHNIWRLQWAEWKDKIFSPFSFTVGGRLVATTIFYTICLKVAIYQFENFRIGVNTISAVRRRIGSALGSFLTAWTLSPRGRAPSTDVTDDASPDGSCSGDSQSMPLPSPMDDQGKGDNTTVVPEEDELPTEENYIRPTFFLDRVIA